MWKTNNILNFKIFQVKNGDVIDIGSGFKSPIFLFFINSINSKESLIGFRAEYRNVIGNMYKVSCVMNTLEENLIKIPYDSKVKMSEFTKNIPKGTRYIEFYCSLISANIPSLRETMNITLLDGNNIIKENKKNKIVSSSIIEFFFLDSMAIPRGYDVLYNQLNLKLRLYDNEWVGSGASFYQYKFFIEKEKVLEADITVLVVESEGNIIDEKEMDIFE